MREIDKLLPIDQRPPVLGDVFNLLYQAVGALDVSGIKNLLELGANSNFGAEYGITPLEYMCRIIDLVPFYLRSGYPQYKSRQYEAAKLLIEAGAEVNRALYQLAKDPTPGRPNYINKINPEVARLILERAADNYVTVKSLPLPEDIQQEILEYLKLDHFYKPTINLMAKYLAQYNSVMIMGDLLLEGVSFYTGNFDNDYMGVTASLVNAGLVFGYLPPAFAIIAPINLGINLYYGTQTISDFSYAATQYIAAGVLKFLGAESIITLVFSAAITLSVMDKSIKLYHFVSNKDVQVVTSDDLFDSLPKCYAEECEGCNVSGSAINFEIVL